jgi:anhydro-N-acetylmuramic acid kinase
LEKYTAIGLMSGSSLDGVDVAYCTFEKNKNWHFEIVAAKTYLLGTWKDKLAKARNADSQTLLQYDADFGKFLGELCNEFLSEFNLAKPDLISSHGHTIFHFPEKGFTCQIGCGANIAAQTNTLTINNLRNADVALGGNGAPIVPIGDKHLFADFAFCLNIGGIANVSYKNENDIVAYDICSANQILNFYAQLCGKEYDNEGELAKEGKLNQGLLDALNRLSFYQKKHPKSLDNGFSNEVFEVIKPFNETPQNTLRTYTEHIAFQIGLAVKNHSVKNEKMLVTGGGALNTFLVERTQENCNLELMVPNKTIIDFKEALVMAFIGVLRIKNETNCLASVTGASRDSVGGVVYYG